MMLNGDNSAEAINRVTKLCAHIKNLKECYIYNMGGRGGASTETLKYL